MYRIGSPTTTKAVMAIRPINMASLRSLKETNSAMSAGVASSVVMSSRSDLMGGDLILKFCTIDWMSPGMSDIKISSSNSVMNASATAFNSKSWNDVVAISQRAPSHHNKQAMMILGINIAQMAHALALLAAPLRTMLFPSGSTSVVWSTFVGAGKQIHKYRYWKESSRSTQQVAVQMLRMHKKNMGCDSGIWHRESLCSKCAHRSGENTPSSNTCSSKALYSSCTARTAGPVMYTLVQINT
mmetsp:Transcript_70118/g.203333  ORF Transcript_70118/g.203333 Transcript_70118/m.203333 type:complete len:242 (+) Transcript_70118:414-1139(+)